MAAQNEGLNIDTVLFFDEANTTDALGMIKRGHGGSQSQWQKNHGQKVTIHRSMQPLQKVSIDVLHCIVLE